MKKQGISKDIIQLGDVIIIHDKDQPRRDWKLGIVQELLTGPDGLTRSAVVKTNNGITTRAVAKLYPLELSVGQTVEIITKDTGLTKNVQKKRKAATAARDKIKSQMEYIN